MVHPASRVASPHASGPSRCVLCRSAVGLGLSAIGLATFTGHSLLPPTRRQTRPTRIGTTQLTTTLVAKNPADVPVEQPAAFALAVKQMSARSLGLGLSAALAAQVAEWIA